MALSNACCAQVYIADSRTMAETPNASVALIVTSPPYWHIKDYGTPCQIGYGQTLHEYLYDLSRVWRECWRVLMPGRRLCINIGDQFARANLYGQYKVIPLHAEIIAQCETIGFDYLGAIIWQKRTTMRPSGGAVVMGSFPYPPNGIVELDYEYILLFRKPGKSPGVSAAAREASALTTDEWKTLFSGHWQFAGERQTRHEAMFPEELPRRLIRMFSLVGETVLDPFVGSGTTLQAALALNRNATGYEIQPDFVPLIRQRLGADSLLPPNLSIHLRETPLPPVEPPAGYAPRIKDAAPVETRAHASSAEEKTYRITAVVRFEGETPVLRTDEGLQVALLGVRVPTPLQTRALNYLKTYVAGKRVLLRFEGAADGAESPRACIHVSYEPTLHQPQNDRDASGDRRPRAAPSLPRTVYCRRRDRTTERQCRALTLRRVGGRRGTRRSISGC